MKSYKFFIPNFYSKNKDKESECIHNKEPLNKITF